MFTFPNPLATGGGGPLQQLTGLISGMGPRGAAFGGDMNNYLAALKTWQGNMPSNLDASGALHGWMQQQPEWHNYFNGLWGQGGNGGFWGQGGNGGFGGHGGNPIMRPMNMMQTLQGQAGGY